MRAAREISRAITLSRFHIAADRFLLAAMEPPPSGDWRERLRLKRDLRRHEVLAELTAPRARTSIARKQDCPTARFVWRTLRDDKVRMTHRANDGRIFSWSAPPPTGHPGEDHNCRCWAEPYVSGETEFASFAFTIPLGSNVWWRWGNSDFVRWYYVGGGQPVDLMEIGHLNDIARHYACGVEGVGAFRRLADQIADKARKNDATTLEYSFERAYDFGAVAFSHGGGRVAGSFSGSVDRHDAVIEITGAASFQFTDEFKDPIGQGFEVGGTPYAISGRWEASFAARVRADHFRNLYTATAEFRPIPGRR